MGGELRTTSRSLWFYRVRARGLSVLELLVCLLEKCFCNGTLLDIVYRWFLYLRVYKDGHWGSMTCICIQTLVANTTSLSVIILQKTNENSWCASSQTNNTILMLSTFTNIMKRWESYIFRVRCLNSTHISIEPDVMK